MRARFCPPAARFCQRIDRASCSDVPAPDRVAPYSREHSMQRFIPFEDDWDALANLRPEDLIPYRVGMLDAAVQRTDPMSPVTFSSSPRCTPMRCAEPADSSNTYSAGASLG